MGQVGEFALELLREAWNNVQVENTALQAGGMRGDLRFDWSWHARRQGRGGHESEHAAIAQAWQWLFVQGLLAPNLEQASPVFVVITPRGRTALDKGVAWVLAHPFTEA